MTRRPACMDTAEYAAWLAADERVSTLSMRAPSPCHDCLPAFALEMRAIDRCDGEPGGVLHPLLSPAAAARRERIGLTLGLLAGGMTKAAIARELGVSRSTVKRYLVEA